MKVLDRLEDIEADEKNSEKPSVDVVIEKTTVHHNPWTKMEKEYEDGVARGVQRETTAAVKTNTEKKLEEEEEEKKKRKMDPKRSGTGAGIGRYVSGSTASVNATFTTKEEEVEEEERRRRSKKAKVVSTKKTGGGFGNFDNW